MFSWSEQKSNLSSNHPWMNYTIKINKFVVDRHTFALEFFFVQLIFWTGFDFKLFIFNSQNPITSFDEEVNIFNKKIRNSVYCSDWRCL